jgi:tRNA(Ile)-lysidine synthase
MSTLLDAARHLPLTSQLLARCTFPAEPSRVDCAVSGGADSVALMVLAAVHWHEVTAWHVDHGLRSGSGDEARIVADLAHRLGVAFESRSVRIESGPNLEARAREARFAVLPEGVLTGHTLDDQAETVLINLIRGAGMRGMAGMRPDGTKPLLALRRAETRALCAALRIDVVEDPMNDDPRFQRSRIRRELLPLLDDIADRDVAAILARQADVFRDDDLFLDRMAEGLDPTDARALIESPAPLARRALRTWLADPYPPDIATVERILGVARGDARACDVGAGRRVRRSRQRLYLERDDTPDATGRT